MAMIKMQMGFSDIKGKLNGSYFQSQKGGISCKTISPRRSRATVLQGVKQTSQQTLGFTARVWGQLSNELVLSWNSYASGFTRYNKLGEPYTPTGYQMYNECNMTLSAAQGSLLSSPVAPSAPQDINLFYVEWEALLGFVLHATEPLNENKAIMVYATPPQYGNRTFPRTSYRLLATVLPADEFPYELQPLLVAAWGTVPQYSQIFFKIKMIDYPSGIAEGSKLTKADAGLV